MKPTIKTLIKKVLAPDAPYTVTLTIGTKEYTCSSADPTEAVFGLKPEKIATRAIFTMTFGEKTSRTFRNIPMTRRILRNHMAAYIIGRNLVARLK